MTNICEEFDLHHVKLMHTKCLLSFLKDCKFHLLTLLHYFTCNKERCNNYHGVYKKCKVTFPERWQDFKTKGCLWITPHAVAICCHHSKSIVSGIKICKGNFTRFVISK